MLWTTCVQYMQDVWSMSHVVDVHEVPNEFGSASEFGLPALVCLHFACAPAGFHTADPCGGGTHLQLPAALLHGALPRNLAFDFALLLESLFACLELDLLQAPRLAIL